MTRLEMRKAKLRTDYEARLHHLDIRLRRARHLGGSNGDRGGVWDKIKYLEAEKTRATNEYLRELERCSGNNRR